MCIAAIAFLQDFENKEQGVFYPYAASDFIGQCIWGGGGMKKTTGEQRIPLLFVPKVWCKCNCHTIHGYINHAYVIQYLDKPFWYLVHPYLVSSL